MNRDVTLECVWFVLIHFPFSSPSLDIVKLYIFFGGVGVCNHVYNIVAVTFLKSPAYQSLPEFFMLDSPCPPFLLRFFAFIFHESGPSPSLNTSVVFVVATESRQRR